MGPGPPNLRYSHALSRATASASASGPAVTIQASHHCGSGHFMWSQPILEFLGFPVRVLPGLSRATQAGETVILSPRPHLRPPHLRPPTHPQPHPAARQRRLPARQYPAEAHQFSSAAPKSRYSRAKVWRSCWSRRTGYNLLLLVSMRRVGAQGNGTGRHKATRRR